MVRGVQVTPADDAEQNVAGDKQPKSPRRSQDYAASENEVEQFHPPPDGKRQKTTIVIEDSAADESRTAAPAGVDFQRQKTSSGGNPIELDKALAKHMRARKRKWRSAVHCFVLLLLVAVWILCILPHLRARVELPYNAATGVSIEVGSCDVDFVTSDSAKITVEYPRYAGRYYEDVTASGAKTHFFHNLDGCNDMPFFSCRRRCLVTVHVSPAASSGSGYFAVSQQPLDPSAPLIQMRPGTTLPSLALKVYKPPSGGSTGLPSASVLLEGAAITGTLTARLLHGSLTTRNTTLGDVDATAEGSGSIYLLDVPVPAGVSASLSSVLQPSGRVCVATDLPPSRALLSTPADPLSTCGKLATLNVTTGTLDYSLDSTALAALGEHYDTDSDGDVSLAEFTTGLGELKKCCGGMCPFVSACSDEAPALGYTEGVITSLPLASLATALVTQQRATYLPRCVSAYALQRLDVSPPPPPALTFSRLHAAAGEVAVTFRHADTSASDRQYTQPRTQRLVAPGRLRGLRLHERDALNLRLRYAKRYAHVEATSNLYMTIDVGGVGVVQSRWIYATNPAYLALDPPHLNFFTAGTLTPPIRRERARFIDNDCAGDAQVAYNESHSNATLRAVYRHLVTALRAEPTSDAPLRGALVLLGEEMVDAFGNMVLYNFEADETGELRITQWVSGSSGALKLAVTLSAVLGGLVALLLVFIIFRALVYIQQQMYDDDKATRSVVLAKMGLSTEQIKERLEGPDGAEKPSFNPFMQPFILLTMLLVEPVRRRWVNSVAKFVRERLTIEDLDEPPTSDTEAVAAPASTSLLNSGRKFVYMRNFAQRYELFCMQNHLNMIEDRTEIQRMLISRFNARVTQLQVGLVVTRGMPPASLGDTWHATRLYTRPPHPSPASLGDTLNPPMTRGRCAESTIFASEILRRMARLPTTTPCSQLSRLAEVRLRFSRERRGRRERRGWRAWWGRLERRVTRGVRSSRPSWSAFASSIARQAHFSILVYAPPGG